MADRRNPTTGVSVRLDGEYHGVFVDGITHPGLCLLNLEHYSAAGRTGRFAPRQTAIHGRVVDGGAVLDFDATEDWRLRARITYALGPGRVDATFRFTFDHPYPGFEAFVASYFPVGTHPPAIPDAQAWRFVRPRYREQVFVPRDSDAAALAQDGRWEVLREFGYSYRVSRHRFQRALMVTTPRGTSIGVAQMADPRGCSQLSPNTFAPAHDLSLVGRDVSAGETVDVRVLLTWQEGLDRSRAVALYDDFVEGLDG